MPLTWCTATLANKRTHSLEQQDKEQPWVVLSEEKEKGDLEEEEGSVEEFSNEEQEKSTAERMLNWKTSVDQT